MEYVIGVSLCLGGFGAGCVLMIFYIRHMFRSFM